MVLNNLMSIVVLIMPGFAALYWVEAWTSHQARQNISEAEKTLRGFLFSLPVMSITWGILIALHLLFPSFIGAMDTFTQLSMGINNILVMLLYVLMNLVVGYLFAKLWVNWLHHRLRRMINKTRNKQGRGHLGEYDRVWDELFHGAQDQVVAIQKFGDSEAFLYGIIDTVSNLDNNEQAFNVIGINEVTKYKERLKEPLYVYVEFARGIMVKVHDPDVLLD